MVKCPKCNQEIDYLICETSELFRNIIRFPKSIEEESDPDYDPDTGLLWVYIEDSCILEDKYICPLCREPIVQDDEEAVRFLKGEQIGGKS